MEKSSLFSSVTAPLLRSLASSDLGVDSVVNFISASYQLLNSNTTNTKLNALVTAFNSLLQSQGFNSYNIFYTLHANVFTIVDATLNIVRIWEGRLLTWRDRNEELNAPDPLDDLLDSFTVTNNNLDFVSRAVRVLACHTNDVDDVVPSECLEPDDEDDATILGNPISGRNDANQELEPLSLSQATDPTGKFNRQASPPLLLKSRQDIDVENQRPSHAKTSPATSSLPLSIPTETSSKTGTTDLGAQQSIGPLQSQHQMASQQSQKTPLSELQSLLEASSKIIQSHISKLNALKTALTIGKDESAAKQLGDRKKQTSQKSVLPLDRNFPTSKKLQSSFRTKFQKRAESWFSFMKKKRKIR